MIAECSIAVVDDNADNRLLLEAMLATQFKLSMYEDGPSALRGIGDAQPDIVLLDISLPGMDGIEVMRRLRGEDDTSQIPIVAVTAHAMAGDEERFIGLGFDAYMSKPILRARQIIDVIETVCQGR